MSSSYCHSCGAELQNGSKFCAKCGTAISIPTPTEKVENGKSGYTHILLFVLAMCILAVIVFYQVQNSSKKQSGSSYEAGGAIEPSSARTPTVIPDSIDTIFENFARNPVSAVQNYKGNLLVISGTVYQIMPHGALLVNTSVGPNRKLSFMVSFSDSSQYARLETGQSVITSGTVSGGTYASVFGPEVLITLEDCSNVK